MKGFIKENVVFLSLYALFLVAGAYFILRFEKGDEIIYLNKLHTPFFDNFFYYVTHILEFPIFIFLSLYLFFSSYGKGVILLLNFLVVFLIITILKQIVFPAEVRPSVFFEGREQLQFVQGMEVLRYHSFPSGHTAGAFSVCFMLSALLKKNLWSVALFIIALLVAVSRVYLLQHFLRDVYVGSLVAVSATAITWQWVYQSDWYNNLSWKDKSLLK